MTHQLGKANKMELEYYEYYPHYMGTTIAKCRVDAMDVAMLLTLKQDGSDEADEMFSDYYDDLVAELDKDSRGRSRGEIFAFHDLFREYMYQIEKDLNTKGFIAEMWEEGSYYLAIPGYEKEAFHVLAELEFEMMTSDA